MRGGLSGGGGGEKRGVEALTGCKYCHGVLIGCVNRMY